MRKYPKIQSIFKRDQKTHKFIMGEYSTPEFEYLAGLPWDWTEKIDGTNIRIQWDGKKVEMGGRTDNAQMPTFLFARLNELFTPEKFRELFNDYNFTPEEPLCLYGEGYGAKIQKGGGNYIPDGVDFILFDVRVGEWWLKQEDMVDIANRLWIKLVPYLGMGTLIQAIDFVQRGMKSQFGDFTAEGMVLRTTTGLLNRAGQRIITKVKGTDFE